MFKILRVLIVTFLFGFILDSAKADDTQYLWAGTNQYRIWIQSEEDMGKQLDAMQDAGLKILRIFLGEAPYQSWEIPPDAYTFESPFGIYDEDNLVKVDYLMQQCKNRGIKLMIALNNHSDEYFDTYGAVGMYAMPAAITNYKNRFTHFLEHENSYLGKKWKNCDDVVYAWEIQNEPGIPLIKDQTLTSPQKHDLMRSFLNEMATHLKSIDPNTKVSLGIAGYANYYHSGGSGDDIRTLGNIADADIYTLHFYGGNIVQWINDNLTWCRNNNKLLFVQEFGKTRDNGMDETISEYKYVIQNCRAKGVPWMFWRMGIRKGGSTWSVFEDDSVWTQVIKQEAMLINTKQTTDKWDVNVVVDKIESNIEEQPKKFRFEGAYPNPFNAVTTFSFYLAESIEVSIDIFNVRGELVKSIQNGVMGFGEQKIDWNAYEFGTGQYLVRIKAGSEIVTQKVSLIK